MVIVDIAPFNYDTKNAFGKIATAMDQLNTNTEKRGDIEKEFAALLPVRLHPKISGKKMNVFLTGRHDRAKMLVCDRFS